MSDEGAEVYMGHAGPHPVKVESFHERATHKHRVGSYALHDHGEGTMVTYGQDGVPHHHCDDKCIASLESSVASLRQRLIEAEARNPEIGFGYWTADGKLSQGDGMSTQMMYETDRLGSEIFQLKTQIAVFTQPAQPEPDQTTGEDDL